MPNMLCEIVEQVLNALPGLRIVRPQGHFGDPLHDARSIGASLLVLRAGDPALAPLDACENLTLLSLAENGREGTLLTLHRQPIVLDGAGLTELGRIAACVAESR